MSRAFNAESFEQEKKLVIAKASEVNSLPYHGNQDSVWETQYEEFVSEFAGAGSEELKDDREAVLAALAVSGGLLGACSDTLRSDLEVVQAAVDKYPWALKEAHPSILDDKEVVLQLVQVDGFALEDASHRLRQDRDVVLEAVKQTGAALRFAGERFRSDKEVVFSALKSLPWSIEHVNPSLRADREVILTALESNSSGSWWGCMVLPFASEGLRGDREVVLAAMENISERLSVASRELQEDKDFLLAAVRRTPPEHRLKRCAEVLRLMPMSIEAEELLLIADSALAIRGDEAPVLTINLSLSQDREPFAEEESKTALLPSPHFVAEVSLLSGKAFSCHVPTTTLAGRDAEDRQTNVSSQSGPQPPTKRHKVEGDGCSPTLADDGSNTAKPTVLLVDLAAAVHTEVCRQVQAATPKRIFMVFSNEHGPDVPVTPWDCFSPLTDFLQSACAPLLCLTENSLKVPR